MEEGVKKVSVVMATYNGAGYVGEQIESVLSQAYRDFEFVICDDCSTDDTVDIVQRYAGQDGRIRVVTNRHNLGFRDNFQRAIECCGNTEYVALCDQDDVWTEDHLQHLMDIIGDKVLACADSTITDRLLKPTGLSLAQQQSFDYIPEDDMLKSQTILLWRNPFQGSAMLVRRSLLDKALPFPEGVDFHDSWLAVLSCFAGGMAYSRHPVSLYRMHGNNASGDKMRRMSRVKALIARVRGLKAGDRIAMIRGIMDRAGELSGPQTRYLREMLGYFQNDSVRQKIRNAVYLLRNYRTIFTKA
ncbi:MAG: glycosyltransferase family 2 protein [Bacteroidaceae bacterium]|nr:glycosyltransferase family 2 protein [Bacteroidaceae bacterium]